MQHAPEGRVRGRGGRGRGAVCARLLECNACYVYVTRLRVFILKTLKPRALEAYKALIN